LPLHQTAKQTPTLKWAGCIQTMGKRYNGLVASSPWGKEKRAGCIQPMGKGKAGWLHPAHGEKKIEIELKSGVRLTLFLFVEPSRDAART